LSQPVRATCAEPLTSRRIADEETMLHLGDGLTGDVQLGRDPIDAIGMQTDGGLCDDGRRVQLVRNCDPIMATKAALREPATDLAPQ